MAGVTLTNIVKRYRSTYAVNDISLDIKEGEFLTLLGPSGCGKTTTLRLISGFINPTSGSIFFGEKDVTGIAPQHRQIGMVFQDYALFPHLTVRDNIAFGLVERKYSKSDISRRVTELLKLIKLEDAGDRYPSEISGGQAQRVAVARAVAHPPSVLLMDEPLGALDLKLRENMQFELRRIQQELGITAVYVTHDQSEAMNMSDRIVVMNAGIIEQIGSPNDIYNNPSSIFVANFIGQVNILQCSTNQDANKAREFLAGGLKISAKCNKKLPKTSEIFLAIRPEDVKLSSFEENDGINCFNGVVVEKVFAGNISRITIRLEGEQTQEVKAECHAKESPFEIGDEVFVRWSPDDCNVLMN